MTRRPRRAISAAPRVPPEEQLLAEAIRPLSIQSVLCTTVGRGGFAISAAQQASELRVVLHAFDEYVRGALQRQIDLAGLTNRITLVCGADFPAETVDAAAIPVPVTGEAELTRDLLQSAFERLTDGGLLLAATRNRRDRWLHEELDRLTPAITRTASRLGAVYIARRKGPLKKRKEFRCEFAFRDGERLVAAVSRPGVFSHRSLDGGARALIATMPIDPGWHVVDMGSGCGAVGVAAALRFDDVRVTAVDSHARAVECTKATAAANGVADRVTAIQAADGDRLPERAFDLLLGNPPYFSDYRIAEVFLQVGVRSLKTDGRIRMVTKTPDWFEDRMSELFDSVQVIPHKTYFVVAGIQRPPAAPHGTPGGGCQPAESVRLNRL
jgi:16S rRNA (guanine1207-N2)-methyltransferase